jgi:hypothetical protein
MRSPLLLSTGLAAIVVSVMGLAAPAQAADCPPGQVLEAPCAAPLPPCPLKELPCDR